MLPQGGGTGFETNVITDWIFWVKYCLNSTIILISCPKFKVYFVSINCWLLNPAKIYSTNWTINGINTEGCFDIGTNNNTNNGIKVRVGNLS